MTVTALSTTASLATPLIMTGDARLVGPQNIKLDPNI
jgi:hypothetical protein